MEVQTLTTARLELQPQTIAHADRLFDCFQDKELYPFITRTPPESRDEFRKAILFLEGRKSRDGSQYWLNWVSIHRQSGELVGKVEVTMDIATRDVHLAYYTFRKHWKQGYARESCLGVITHLFQHYATQRVVIEMDVRNTASVKLAESLGAKRTAHNPKVQMLKGEWSDEYQYELLATFG